MAGLSYKAAVEAKCKGCGYDPGAPGGWRQQIAGCLSMDCALYAVRPTPLPVRGTKRAR